MAVGAEIRNRRKKDLAGLGLSDQRNCRSTFSWKQEKRSINIFLTLETLWKTQKLQLN